MTTLGKYELHEELGRGGFGTVYRAVDTTLGREVALKVLHPQLTVDPDFLEKFRNEARVIASLDSPNIVTIYEMGEADGRVFIAMRYMAGGSLKDKLAREGKLSFEETLHIMKQVCAGLDKAHQKGLVHRDIKPANILFDEDGNAVVSDFGLAKAIEKSSSTATSSTGGVGTPSYRSPELWEGKPPASPASDIYSLGCVISEILTGKKLFDGDSTNMIITQHLVTGPVLPKHFPDGVPEGITIILDKSLKKEQETRYQKAKVLLKELTDLSDLPETPKNNVIKDEKSSNINEVSAECKSGQDDESSEKQTRKSAQINLGIWILTVGLISLGIAFGRSSHIQFLDFMWPFVFIIPGLIILFIGKSSGEINARGVTILGSLIVVLGLIFQIQVITYLWASWAYAWALIAPFSLGLGQWIYAIERNERQYIEVSRRLMIIGLFLFFAGFLFFELVIGISGFGLASYGLPVLPMMLIFIGIVMVFVFIFRQIKTGK